MAKILERGRQELVRKRPYHDLRRGHANAEAYELISTSSRSHSTVQVEPFEGGIAGCSAYPQGDATTLRPQLDDAVVERPGVDDLTRPSTTPHPETSGSGETITKETRQAPFPWILTLSVIFPILIPTIVLFALVLRYRVTVRPSLFSDSDSMVRDASWCVLVDYPDTRLVFVASILNIITGPLASWIMSLYAPKVARTLRLAPPAESDKMLGQPTPFQMTLIGGICQASTWQHAKYYWSLPSQTTAKGKESTPPALRQASSMLLLVNFLQVAMFAAITVLHLTVDTVSFDDIRASHPHNSSLGLSELCLAGDRALNYYPCSYNLSNPNLPTQLRNEFALEHKSSKVANIEFVKVSELDASRMAVLTPSSAFAPSNVDFRASSIGVTTECSYITTSCRMRYMAEFPDPNTYKTVFNCSTGFYGVLGEIAQLSDGSMPAGDSNVPSLCFKPAPILQ